MYVPISPSLPPASSYQLATGSSENVVKVWDMRKRTNIYTIPAHSALVAAVNYVRVGAGGRGRKGDMG